jgi:hypothetical protein
MKKILFLAAIAVSAFSLQATAQANNYQLANPDGSYVTGSFPNWFTNLDTITGATTDTFYAHMCKGWVTSYNNTLNGISFSNNIWTAGTFTVTPTVTVALYESADCGASYATTPTATYTVVPSSLTAPKTNIIQITGNPASDYMTVFTGSANAVVSHKGCILLR